MKRFVVTDCGKGLNADQTPEELGDGVWSSTTNMRFENGYAVRFRGMTAAFTTPVVTPYFCAPYATTTKRFLVYAGLTAIYADDGTTQTDVTGTAPTGTAADRWTGGALNGVMVLNNGVDKPQFWGGDTAANFAALTGWPATYLATSIRSFKNFLIALGINKAGTKYPHMVKWSDVAVPGAIPTSWDETDATKDAGEQDLAETSEIFVDSLPLGDVLVLYKERSMYSMTYVGAPYIWRFQRLPGDVGMLAPGCATATPVGHVVMASGDIFVHSGLGPTSIANGVIRKFIFNNIDSTYYKRSFVTQNPQKNEVWVCFPSAGSSDGTCDMAAIWNWSDKTWYTRTLTSATYGAHGQFNLTSTDTWDGDSGTWDSDATSWNENEYSPAEARLVMCNSTPRLTVVDTGTTDYGSTITASLERTGMTFGDPSMVKTITAVRPKIDSTDNASITLQVGGAMYPDGPVTWSTAVTFMTGTSIKADTFASGRFIGIRMSNVDYPSWRLRSFDVEFAEAGSY